MAIRPEFSGDRSLAFSKWIRENCPDTSTGYVVENLDWLFHNYKNRILLIAEEKTHGGMLGTAQSKLFYGIIEPSLRMYCDSHDIQFLGFHTIRFENTCPTDGAIFWDNKLISEETLKERLSW